MAQKEQNYDKKRAVILILVKSNPKIVLYQNMKTCWKTKAHREQSIKNMEKFGQIRGSNSNCINVI